MGDPDWRKLNTLALTALFTTAQPWMLRRLQELMSLWTDVITELVDEETGVDTMTVSEGARGWGIHATAMDERILRLEEEDVLRTVDIKTAVRGAVEGVVTAVGREEFERWVGDVDADVVKAFGALGVV